MAEKISIYPAAALFNARETMFNSYLVEGLEEKGYETNFPQRDGFEFGNLTKALSGKLEYDEIDSAVQDVIYFLDMGKFIPKSDVVVANLDEPHDEGMLVEASHARSIGKYVVGFRTDVRSPYGQPTERFGGMHFFPGYQTNEFILHPMHSRTPEERDEKMESLVGKIDSSIKDAGITHDETIPEYALNNPNIRPIFEGAKILFSGICDIHSEEGLEEIALRYINNKKKLDEARPKRR